MGRNKATRHQKSIKSEKAKTKLKKKKVLPKGTNETKTDFKVKKIVLRTQVKPPSEETLSNTQLSFQELSSRLQHFNVTSRKDALVGIRELAIKYSRDVLIANAGQMITKVVPLVLDIEKLVRREAYHTLHMILSNTTIPSITPFFNILCSYLRCAMTHLNTQIHEDSLFYFDILLECVPKLIASNVNKILPSFLDMISKLKSNSVPGRTLSINLGSKMTSVKWRTKVLTRLSQLLRIMVKLNTIDSEIEINENDELTFLNNKQDSHKMNNSTFIFSNESKMYFPLYKEYSVRKFSFFGKERNFVSKDDVEEKLQLNVELLIPLLFDTWLEVRPEHGNSKKSVSIISEEAVTILKHILDIIIFLWQILSDIDKCSGNSELKRAFVDKFQKPFTQHVFNSFPYSYAGARQNQSNSEKNEGICLEQNLKICYIYIKLNNKISLASQQSESLRVLKYINQTLNQITSKDIRSTLNVIAIFGSILNCPSWNITETLLIFDKIGCLSKECTDVKFKQNVFEFLSGVFLDGYRTSSQSKFLPSLRCRKNLCFQNWLSELPDILSNEGDITQKCLNLIHRFAVQDTCLFNETIKDKLKFIIMNLPHLNIVDVDDKNENIRKILSLLYWVNCWSIDSLNVLEDHMRSNKYGVSAKEYLVDILKLKKDTLFPRPLNEDTLVLSSM